MFPPLLLKRYFLRLLLNLRKLTVLFGRFSTFLLGLLRRSYHKLRLEISDSRQHLPPTPPSHPNSHSHGSHDIIKSSSLDSNDTHVASMSIPIYPSYLPTSTPALILPTETQDQASRSSQELNVRHSFSAFDLEDSRQRRVSSPSASPRPPSLSIPNVDSRYNSRASSPSLSQHSNRSWLAWVPDPRPDSRSSSRSRRTYRHPRDPRPRPDPYKTVGQPTVPFLMDERAPSPSMSPPLTPIRRSRRLSNDTTGIEFSISPASPRTPSSGNPSVSDGRDLYTQPIEPASRPLSLSSDNLSVRDDVVSEGDKPTPSQLRDVNKMFVPISPEILGRYDRREVVANESKEMIIASLTFAFEDRELPEGWERSISPEGTNLFYNTAKHIWTDANIFSDKYFAPLSQFIQEYEGFMKSRNIVLTSEMEMIMDVAIYPKTGKWMCSYYFVDHRFKTVFWLDKFDPCESFLWGEILGVTTNSHLGICIEKFYWEHAIMFPKSRDKYASEDLRICRGLLLQAWSDTMTSLTSTFPFSSVECETYLRMMDQVEKEISLSVSNGSTPMDNISFSISRLMNDFTKSRFMNFYGEPSVRLNRDESVHSTGPRTHTWLVTLMRPILFRTPDAYLNMLEQVYVDGMTHTQSWRVVIGKMSSEWQEITLFATVLLNANVGFLDIDSVSGTSERTVTQVMSYLSTITSIGSIIIGLLLIRMNRDHAGNDSRQALQFLQPRESSMHGLEILAMLYSMPFALLMWSMVLFLAAFSLMCLVDTPGFVRGPVSSIWWMVFALIIWALYVTWDRNHGHRLSPITVLVRRLTADNDDTNNTQQQQQTQTQTQQPQQQQQQHQQQNTYSPGNIVVSENGNGPGESSEKGGNGVLSSITTTGSVAPIDEPTKPMGHRRVWGSLDMKVKRIFQKSSAESGTAAAV